MKRLLALMLLAALLLSLTACGQTAAPPPTSAFFTLEELLVQVNANHRAVRRPDIDLAAYVADFEEVYFDLAPYQPDWEDRTDPDPDLPLTAAQVAKDVEVLHSVLKSTYPPYYHFGGRAVFNPVFESIVAEAKEAEAAGTLTTDSFMWMLSAHLGPVIKDAHFTLNYGSVNPRNLPYRLGTNNYMRLENGDYYNLHAEKTVTAVEGYEDLDTLFKLAIAEDGALVYWPILLEYNAYYRPETVLFTHADGSEEALSSELISTHNPVMRSAFSELAYNGDIPVLHTIQMGFDRAPEGMGAEFIEQLAEVQDKPVAIIDLTDNPGGNMIMSLKWLGEYAGQPVPSKAASVTTLSDMEMSPESPYYVPTDEWEMYNPLLPINEKYYTFERGRDEMVANPDRLLVLLISKGTASAAETFVETAHNLENTLIVGTNTSGTLLSNAYTYIALPESDHLIGFGCTLFLYPDGFFSDFMGMEPDIWADGDPEEAVLNMLAYLEQ